MSGFSVISDLRPKLKQVNLKFKVVSKSDVREVNSRLDDTPHKVSEAVVGDETGVITMTLWDDQIDLLEEGKTYILKNGYIGFFKNTLRLNIGRYGSIENSDEEISDVNLDNDLSQKTYERRYGTRSYGGRGRY
ncbi:MAG: single-stranded DNA-binding protein [Candidatus Asgardarchaeia archaeon]